MPEIVLVVARPELGAAILGALEGLCDPVLVASARDIVGLSARLEPRLLVLELGPPPLADARALGALRSDLHLRFVPVLAIGRSRREFGLLEATSAGADAFMSAPLAPSVLAARAARLLGRARRAWASSQMLKRGDLRLDLSARRVWLSGRALDLTQTEFLILAELLRRAGSTAGRQALKASLWSAREVCGHTLESHVSNLRRKLGGLAVSIETVPGKGWRLSLLPGPLRPRM